MSTVVRARSESSGASGYLHRGYAESFSDIAIARELRHCGGWILERAIPGSDLRDGMGCYPLFACRDWRGLVMDLPTLAGHLVSLSLITDPFGNFTEDDLHRYFDLVVPYKQHHVTDLAVASNRGPWRSHARSAARARKSVQLEVCSTPLELLDDWVGLYDQLTVRHGITGIAAFSRRGFEKQLAVPGLVMFKASADDHVVGLHLWYVQGDVAYGHLGATSARGYELMASYALYSYAIEQLRGRARWLDLGSSAGAPNDESGSGLRRFKAGWATGSRQAYLCGRIFQPEAYARLVAAKSIGSTSYFPAYRQGEFAQTRREPQRGVSSEG
jgi:Acetyltransferase (GNAT) domain